MPKPVRLLICCLLLTAAPALAQMPAGDGLLGQYYDGQNFERVMYIRRDATIDFDWAGAEPAPGLPAEHFSVRWTGWLVPPVSGRYKFHVTVDDGMRLWINERLILNEWRDQPVRGFTATVELKAGEKYRLRVDYYQNILDTRARLSWERPDAPGLPAASRRAGSPPPRAEPIPSRYLFSKDPGPAVAARPPAVPAKPSPTSATGGPAPARQRPAPAVSAPRLPQPPPRATPAAAAVASAAADSAGAARVARLDEGEAVTLPDLYFNRGEAVLLPPARAALDGLATALRARPGLRLEVQGHTDNVGDAERNRQLSQRRAEAVCLYLTAHGVPQAQLRPVGYGGTRPVADNADPAQRPKNRRVVLVKQGD